MGNWERLEKLNEIGNIKINRKVQGVPQSHAAAKPWHQQEEKTDTN